MIRDMDLVRQLLGEIANGKEEYALIEVPEKFNQPEQYEIDKKIKYHLEILQQAEFISWGKYSEDMSGMCYFQKVQLTWSGQEYYATIKSDTIWNNTKNHLTSKALNLGEVGIDMLIAVAKAKVEELLGISLAK